MNATLIFAALIAGGEPESGIVPAPDFELPCWRSRAEAEAFVAEKLHQVRAAAASTYDAGQAVIYANETGDWTLLVTLDGMACITDYGTGWSLAPRGRGF